MHDLNIQIHRYTHRHTHCPWILKKFRCLEDLSLIVCFFFLLWFNSSCIWMDAFLLIQLSYLDDLPLKYWSTYQKSLWTQGAWIVLLGSNNKTCPNGNFIIILTQLVCDSNSSYSAVTITQSCVFFDVLF